MDAQRPPWRADRGALLALALLAAVALACLLANHGMIALDASLEAALALAIEVEALAEQYWRVLQIGAPNLLSDTEMDIVLEKFRNYGQQAGQTRSSRR